MRKAREPEALIGEKLLHLGCFPGSHHKRHVDLSRQKLFAGYLVLIGARPSLFIDGNNSLVACKKIAVSLIKSMLVLGKQIELFPRRCSPIDSHCQNCDL
jgi:hypothetical protein